MIRATTLLLFITLTLSANADQFKFKLKLETVNHEEIGGTIVTFLERGKTAETVKVKDQDIKVDLIIGRVYEVWIQKEGYIPHVIHNVHNEGDNKNKVTLYKSKEKYPGGIPPYHLANRVFEDVTKMVVPADMLNDQVLLVKEEEMSTEERVSLGAIQEKAKDQEKRQKEIDKLQDDNEDIDKKIKDITEKIAKGDVARKEGEEDIEKLNKKRDKNKKKLKDLAY